MEVHFRLFNEGDIDRIGKFLGRLSVGQDNERKVIWDCLLEHPCFEMFHPEKIGIWENDFEIVGIVRLESPWYGGIFADIDPEYSEICRDMIDYAEKTFSGKDDDGNKYLNVFARDNDILPSILTENGYCLGKEGRMLFYPPLLSLKEIKIPEDFQIKSLRDVYSFEKLNALLWKAFEYEGAPPSYDDEVYLPRKHAWLGYNKDICTVVIAPDQSYASFCGIWYDQDTRAAFIEPLATAPGYRKLGLASACILESIRKCREIGAVNVFVEPDEEAFEWYTRIGFKKTCYSHCWVKRNLQG